MHARHETTKITLFSLVGLLLILGSCQKSVVEPSPVENLIQNPGFEENGAPSLAGWTITDASLARVEEDSSSGQGKWCLWVGPVGGYPAEPAASTFITGQTGRGRYIMSCYAKVSDSTFFALAGIQGKRNGTLFGGTSTGGSLKSWFNLAALDTFTLEATDTLVVSLGCGSFSTPPQPTPEDTVHPGALFTKISLTRIQ
jgi:hypothetical protein